MELDNKSAVDVIQELLAIHTDRKEAVQKLSGKSGSADQFHSMAAQSDQFISDLMEELAKFGDAVQAGPPRENEYQQLWRQQLSKVNDMTSDDATALFSSLESKLKDVYEQLSAAELQLPESLIELIADQKEDLQKN